jgi:hypothetical protein
MARSDMPAGTFPGGDNAPAAPVPETTIATRDVTEIRTMPIHEADGARAPHDDDARSNAGDQAGDVADRIAPPAPAAEQPRTRRGADQRIKPVGRSRPQRWRDAVVELLALQAEYAQWLAALPDSLSDSPTAEALEAIVDLDLTELADIEPPRGYGRD